MITKLDYNKSTIAATNLMQSTLLQEGKSIVRAEYTNGELRVYDKRTDCPIVTLSTPFDEIRRYFAHMAHGQVENLNTSPKNAAGEITSALTLAKLGQKRNWKYAPHIVIDSTTAQWDRLCMTQEFQTAYVHVQFGLAA